MEIYIGIMNCVICCVIAVRLWNIETALKAVAKEIEFLRKHRTDL